MPASQNTIERYMLHLRLGLAGPAGVTTDFDFPDRGYARVESSAEPTPLKDRASSKAGVPLRCARSRHRTPSHEWDPRRPRSGAGASRQPTGAMSLRGRRTSCAAPGPSHLVRSPCSACIGSYPARLIPSTRGQAPPRPNRSEVSESRVVRPGGKRRNVSRNTAPSGCFLNFVSPPSAGSGSRCEPFPPAHADKLLADPLAATLVALAEVGWTWIGAYALREHVRPRDPITRSLIASQQRRHR